MNTKNTEIVMSFASLGSYRLNTMVAIQKHYKERVQIFSGDQAPESSIKIIGVDDLDHRLIKNYLLPRAVVIQRVPVRVYMGARVLMLDLNPRMPLTWLFLALRKALRRRTILWGHAFPRAGREARSDVLRSVMRSMSSGLVAYTRLQAEQLRELHPGIPIWAAPNSLYPRAAFGFDAESERNSFIYVGRLHADKKPFLLIDAFEHLYHQKPDLRLVIVGDGPLRHEISRRASESPAASSIDVLGHIEDYSALRRLYSKAIASVSPGYVGLSVTQSLSFGVPMIISRDEPHAPEIEAVTEGLNCEYFATDCAQMLTEKMSEFAENHKLWAEKGSEISRTCAEMYSVEAMVQGLMDALENRQP